MLKRILIIVVVMLVMTVVSPVTAKPDVVPPNGWSFSAVPQKTCFPATSSVPASIKVDVTVNAPANFFPLLLTFDPPLFSGVLPNTESIEISESGTTTVGWLMYFDGFGTETKDYTFTLTSLGKTIGKSMAETVTITWGACPIIDPPLK